ncbi:right-handed parallel beta-helix repeat-containing protein [Deinococcus sp. 23YEL01]|uniref:right-handed parallel beta-helix repeat-containing protein n=2 Tax=unclassified Deinococcus TaxID=2623546 RepID=UPI001E352922|nr:right-handed parallel beta-helix repeat-containing protein [Deinococcus sp. 23YEL01]MCD0170093.1 right-handed parallel beta-helix repeat-containing protein [Deinococcus sp. 23YEL01]
MATVTTVEAETAELTSNTADIQPQGIVEPGAPTGGQIITDTNASGGKAVNLLSNGSTVAFKLDSTVVAGQHELKLRARGVLYNGAPIVVVRINGQEVGRATLSSTTYSDSTIGTFQLAAGNVVSVTFINDAYGGPGRDRNAVIDHLILTPRTAAVTQPVAPTPTPTPTPTPVPAPTPTPLPGDSVSVKDFGARGDGRTDDAAALRRALATRGKNIHFPAGTYIVGSVVTVDGASSQKLTGTGATIQASPSFVRQGDNAVLYIKNARDLVVDGLTVAGHRTDSTNSSIDIDGVRVASSQNVTLQNTAIGRAPTNGLTILSSQNVTVQDSKFAGSTRHGIWSSRSDNVRLLRNTVQGNGAPNNLTYGGIGILATVGTGFHAEGNTITDVSDTATKTEAVSNVTYRGNTIRTFGKDGIKVMPHPPSGVNVVSNAVIEGNTISGYNGWSYDGSGSILVQSTLGGSIRNNTITGPTSTSGTQDEDGIRVNTYGSGPRSTDITVQGNQIRGVKTGLRLNADKLNVTNNRVQATTFAAVLGGTGINLTGNPELTGGASVTVLFDNGTQANLTGNTLSGPDVGIYAANSGNRGVISQNTFASTYKRTVVAGSGVTVNP